jgi:AraC family transcriptional regulator, regulatory protein of adaptative response / DNA-3-methyladenine glycosylase II
VIERVVRPAGHYSLQLTARRAGDATRRFEDGALTAVLPGGSLAGARQLPDGHVVLRGETEEAVERLRFVLALDDDHTPFLRRFGDDPLVGEATRRLRGLRQLRVPTVAQALLRAFCGQLIESGRARSLERRIVRATTRERTGTRLHAPPTAPCLAAVTPARLRAHGLHARRAAALVRLCGSVDLERLHDLPTTTVVARLARERGLGPWSAAVVCLEGLGRTEHGLVGDLGLVKVLRGLRGRPVEAWETAELLEPYHEWAGLASVYLLAAYGAGLLPVPRRAAA